VLDDSRAQAIVITAPAGYGKTTLVTEWLQGKDGAVWYRATSASADLAAFSAGLTDVLAALVPNAGERLKQRLRVADTPERAARPLAELLAEDLAQWPDDALLIVDDYHLVAESAAVEDFFDWLLTLARQLRVVATGRRRPRWASARRILYGEITEIGRDQLAMNAEEAARVLGEGRSSESVRALVSQAEGWPALIGLAALTASREIPTERVSDALYRYFAEEVVRREAPEVERFMLLASIPATINARVAREVLGIEDPEPLLEGLAEEGLVQQAGGDFHFHPLLRSFLRKRLAERDLSAYAKLISHAIADSRTTARWEEAFELAFEDRRVDDATEILVEATADMLASGRIETLERWLDECGQQAIHSTSATLARVEVLIRKGQLSDASAIAHDLTRRLSDDDPLASRAYFLAGHALYLGSGSSQAVGLQRRAKELARDNDDLKRALWGLFMSENELGEESAQEHLAELDFMAAAVDDLDTRLRVAVGRQAAGANRGSFGDLLERSLPLVAISAYAEDPMARTTFLVNVSYLCVAHADYEQGLKLASSAFRECHELGFEFAKGYCLATIALANAGLRAFRTAHQAQRDLETIAHQQNNVYLRWSAEITSMRLALACGQPNRALAGRSLDFADEIPVPASQGEYAAILGLAAAAVGDDDLAGRCTQTSKRRTSAIEARFFGRFAEVIATGAHSAGSNKELTSLFEETRKASFEDAIVLAYRLRPRLLDELRKDGRAVPPLIAVMKRANDLGLARSHFPAATSTEARSPLTPREQEVFELLATGLSNAEIAERLFISPSTAKVHVQHVLKKLGVKTRLQAAMQAPEKQRRSI
jgi:ATP/maltotriose-dependent transcriptional regulator MalT